MAIPRKRPSTLIGVPDAISRGFKKGSDGAQEYEKEFESAFAEFVHAEEAIATSGARTGLWCILQFLKKEFGVGEVIVPALTASIVPNMVFAAGFKVVFAEVSGSSFGSGPDEILPLVNEKTRAVITTHLEGFPVRADEVKAALSDRDILVIEDAAHALGARVQERSVGSLADVAIFSLGKGKQLNAISGGVVTTGSTALARELRKLLGSNESPGRGAILKRVAMVQAMRLATLPGIFDVGLWPGIRIFAAMGQDPLVSYFEDSLQPPGPEGPPVVRERLGSVQAILGLNALRAYPRLLERRKNLWSILAEASERGGWSTQTPVPSTSPAPLEFVLRVQKRDVVRRMLRAKGIDTQPTWMMAPSSLPAFRDRTRGEYPLAEALYAELLYIPFYPALRDREVEVLVDLLKNPICGMD